ncbi:MAG TPA: IclR family transcriptional regulator [Pseudorhodoferax sp.]|jgi:DNA-binding IclR family transcriptional regulator|nr:IclR family transcriptional regulator [Pseudorhodoferax sp.]
MSSLTRMLSVLDLFSREHETMSAEEIAEALALARTTCYRYTKELSSAGLLVSIGGRFTLGPRIIQLDHRIRESDPLLNAGKEVLAQLARAVGATGLLATVYRSEIINIYQCGSEEALQLVTYGRGTSVPTFRSSSSKVILAALSRARLRRIWADNADDPDCQAIGADWLAFWQALQAIKRNGYWISRSEVDSSLVGIAAPVFHRDEDVAGSMTLIFQEEAFSLFDAETLGARLLRAAQEVSTSLSTR